MAKQTSKIRLPPDIAELVEKIHRDLQTPATALIVWNRHFSAGDRRRLGDVLARAFKKFQTIGMWMKVHQVTAPRALADLALELHFITEMERRQILAGFGE